MEAGEQLEGPVDDFVVGNRVYVSGAKKGKIAFLGETRFSPGEWAGVVLDEPVGKNDGTVSGVRYFTCEPLRGIFCKIDKLSHCNEPISVLLKASMRPLASPAARSSLHGANAAATYSPNRQNGRELRDSVSGSTPNATTDYLSAENDDARSEVSDASFAAHEAALNGQVDFGLGDRVLVSDANAGVVRFIGETRFAAGTWVGVELDEPRGKNDGSVHGVRYFACRPLFGLLAPAYKVRPLTEQAGNAGVPSRDARSFMPSQSDAPAGADAALTGSQYGVQPTGATLTVPQTGFGLRAAGSRESLGGASSVCSSASRPGASRMMSGAWGAKATPSAAYRQYTARDAALTSTSTPRPGASGTHTPANANVKQAYVGSTQPLQIGAAATPSSVALQKVLREQHEHIEALQRELYDEQHELAKQTARADALERQVCPLRDQLAQLASEKDAAQERLHEQCKHVEQLEFELAEHEATCESNASTCGDSESEKRRLEKELHEAKQALERAESRTGEMRRSLDEARRGWKDARDSCTAYLDEIDRLRTDLSTRRTDAGRGADPGPSLAVHANAPAERAATEEPLSPPAASAAECARCAELTERIAELELRLRTSERERCEYVEKKRTLQTQNGELRTRIAATDEQLASVQARLAETAEQRTVESQRRAEAERVRVALQAQLDDVRLRYEALLERCRSTAEKGETERHAHAPAPAPAPAPNGADHDPA